MDKAKAKLLARKARHRRIRKKVFGTQERPRLSVFRSLKHISAQIINDVAGTTLASASSLNPSFRQELNGGSNQTAAKVVGRLVAEAARDKGIKQVIFDRGGYSYHGRVKALAEAARENGLVF